MKARYAVPFVLTSPFFGLLVWSFWRPGVAAVTYLICLVLLEGFAVLFHYVTRCGLTPPLHWPVEEMDALRKHCLFFQAPPLPVLLAAVLTLNLWIMAAWVPWLLWNGLWVLALLIAANMLVADDWAKRLNPLLFLRPEVEDKGNFFLKPELEVVNSVCEKLDREERLLGGLDHIFGPPKEIGTLSEVAKEVIQYFSGLIANIPQAVFQVSTIRQFRKESERDSDQPT